MRSSRFQTWGCTRALFSPTQGAWVPHPRQEQLHAGVQRGLPIAPGNPHRFPSKIWKCTTPPCLCQTFCQRKGLVEKGTHTGPSWKAHWGPSQGYAAATSPASHKTCLCADKPQMTNAPNFALGRSERQQMPGSQMKWVFLAQPSGRGATTGQKWGAQAEPRVLSLEIRDCSF